MKRNGLSEVAINISYSFLNSWIKTRFVPLNVVSYAMTKWGIISAALLKRDFLLAKPRLYQVPVTSPRSRNGYYGIANVSYDGE